LKNISRLSDSRVLQLLRLHPDPRSDSNPRRESEIRLKPTKNPDSTVTNFSPLQRTLAMRQGFQSLSDSRTHRPTKNPDSTVTNFSPLQRTLAMRQGFQSLSDSGTHRSTPDCRTRRSHPPTFIPSQQHLQCNFSNSSSKTSAPMQAPKPSISAPKKTEIPAQSFYLAA